MLQGATAVESGADVSASQCQRTLERGQSSSLVYRVKVFRNRIAARLNRLGLKDRDFSILSNDCWAEELYLDWGLACRTPFRGLGMAAPYFLRFVSDLPRYLQAPLEFIPESRHKVVNRLRREYGWPIGLLGGDLEIYFLYYHNEEDARRTWEEGCRSINPKRIAVKFTVDKDGSVPEFAEQFSRLPFERKLLLTKLDYPEIPCAVRVSRYVTDGALMFRRSLRDFDCTHWLNTGQIRRRSLRVFLNRILYFRGV
jgi:uncharacterized protein (DUF1919 family)